jgi:hypothetical protein
MNFSKNTEPKTELKTSQEWYKTLHVQNIVDPDGWRDISHGEQGFYWHTKLINWSEFETRYRKCTVTNDLKKMPTYPYFESLDQWEKANYTIH